MPSRMGNRSPHSVHTKTSPRCSTGAWCAAGQAKISKSLGSKGTASTEAIERV